MGQGTRSRSNYIEFEPVYKFGCKASKSFYKKFGDLTNSLVQRLGIKPTKVATGTFVIDELQKRCDFVNVVTFANVELSKEIKRESHIRRYL